MLRSRIWDAYISWWPWLCCLAASCELGNVLLVSLKNILKYLSLQMLCLKYWSLAWNILLSTFWCTYYAFMYFIFVWSRENSVNILFVAQSQSSGKNNQQGSIHNHINLEFPQPGQENRKRKKTRKKGGKRKKFRSKRKMLSHRKQRLEQLNCFTGLKAHITISR